MSVPAQRHKARHFAMQAVYQWQMNKLDPKEIAEQFKADNDMSNVDIDYFAELLNNAVNQAKELDLTYAPYLKERSLPELDAITIALLRIATYELLQRIDVPFKVVITEAVGLAKKFGAADSHKFINAVLDQAAAKIRSIEFEAQAQ